MRSRMILIVSLILMIGFWSGLVSGEDAYMHYTWTVTYGTAAPLGVPQQVITLLLLYCQMNKNLKTELETALPFYH